MKKLFTLLLICSIVQSIYGQECSNLFISEILFGSQSSTAGERVVISDYAVEIFNPSEDAINLSDYELELISESEEVTQIFLDGEIGSGETFVVANPNASEGILQKADLIEDGLSFKGQVVLQLTSNASVIDRIGNVGEGIDLSDIDLDLLQNDPNYINEIIINLGSIENLDLRRWIMINEGEANFSNIHVLQNWLIHPSFLIDDVGIHFSSCATPVMYFEDVDAASNIPEIETPEANEIFFPGVIKISEPFNEDGDPLTFTLSNVAHEYFSPFANDAILFADYEESGIAFDHSFQTYSLQGWDITPWRVKDDGINFLKRVGTGVQITNFQSGDTGVRLDDKRKLWDVFIFDGTDSTTDKFKPIGIDVFPTLFYNQINIASRDESNTLRFDNIELIDGSGKIILSKTFNQINNLKLDFLDSLHRGIYFLKIDTNKGDLIKKVFKI